MITPGPAASVYRRLADELRERITSGNLAPGQRFPSEKDLIDEHGVARETVRKALAILKAEGLIVVRHGYPTRVREQEPETATVKVMRGSHLSVRPATPADQDELGVGDGRAVAVLTEPGGKVRLFVADRTEFTFA